MGSRTAEAARIQTTPKQKIRYVLYSHWDVDKTDEHLCNWEKNDKSRLWLSEQPVCRHLRSAKSLLLKLLNETRGLLVLFFDPGWKLALKPSLSPEEKARLDRLQDYASAVADLVVDLPERKESIGRLRMLTAWELKDFIQGLQVRDRQKIHRWFVGEKGQGTYDSPKIVEAFLRVRLIGSGVPLLRIDWDALLRIEKGQFSQLGLAKKAIRACLIHDDHKRKDAQVRTWVCSVGYELPSRDDFDSWSRGFATRIQPALKANAGVSRLVYGEEHFGLLSRKLKAPPDLSVEEVVQAGFDSELAERFLGVGRNRGKWKERSETSIATLGAHPLRAVISGALLNLSASAILDLPPFSNMTRGVMWIDDHLKFEMHRSLGHLSPGARGTCRIAEAVVKGRTEPPSNLAAYVWASYLPVLLRGLVMDSWIRAEGRPLAEGLKKAISTGEFDHLTGLKLEQDLRDVAIRRIEKVRSAWAALKAGTMPTLVSAWASGSVEKLILKHARTEVKVKINKNSPGGGLVERGTRTIRSISDLRKPIQQELRELIWDAVDYVEMTTHWPGMIQTIRAVEKPLVPF